MMAKLEDSLQRKLRGWRDAKQRIVFTNGVFDLLHGGHLALLHKARSFGDVLIVGLNSDLSVRKLDKGEERPLQPQAVRQALLAEMRCVDAVVLFDEETPLELVRLIKPDVLVKGADYTPEQVVGREDVELWGGRVELVELEPGQSTTELINKIRTE